MKIKLNNVIVTNQERALKFYTEILGFVKKAEIPVGDYKWLTVVSPDETEGAELLLEPNANPAAKIYQEKLYEQEIPLTSFAVEDIQGEYDRLIDLGVEFKMVPTDIGTATVTVFDDTCGNLIQLYQV